MSYLEELAVQRLNLIDPKISSHRSINSISTESKRTKTLILECISYCKMENAIEYEVNRLLDCSDSITRLHRGVNVNKRCSNEVNFQITLYYPEVNRFGDKRMNSKFCAWSGYDYAIESDCERK
jgi:hypothetical protein